MDIGKEHDPIELPVPAQPDEIPAETPLRSPARYPSPSGHQHDQPGCRP